ncbi:MAG: hypothetical protein U0359_13240 [Byssovorax sp.]
MPTRDLTAPEHLAETGAAPRVFETFGLGPPLVAAALTAGALYFVLTPGRAALGIPEVIALVVLLGGALTCIRHEALRRRRRAVLVAIEGGIGVYCEGRLEGVMTARDLNASRSHEVMPLKGLLGLAFVALAFVGYGLTETGEVVSRIAALSPGCWLLLLTGSFMRSALLCETFDLPGRRGRALLPKFHMGRIRRPE